MEIPTIKDIQTQIISEKNKQDVLNDLDSTSNVSIYGLWAFCVATTTWMLYSFFSLFKTELESKIREQKIYSLLWFRNAALNFRYGQAIVNGKYSDQGLTAEQIENSKVIKRAAVDELELNNRISLFIKIATEDANGNLMAVPNEVLQAVKLYYGDTEHGIKPAGTRVVISTGSADDLKITIDFYYNPLVLDDSGTRIDGSNNTPVQDVVRNYLKNLKFNGEFTITTLQDLLQNIDGCSNREAYIRECSANFQNPINFQPVEASYVANAGYMTITDDNLKINFIPKPEPL